MIKLQSEDPLGIRSIDKKQLLEDLARSVGSGASNKGKIKKKRVKKLSPNQMNRAIKTGNAPAGIKRVDVGKVPGEKTHVHFKDGAALNKDGTWKHGQTDLTKAQGKWLGDNGWVLPD